MPIPCLPRFLVAILCVVSLTLVAGCSRGPKTVPVSGRVTVDGEPLSGFVISFIPDAEKGHTAELGCDARLGKDGEYSLSTDDRFNVYKGAPPGWYKVTLGSPEDKPIPVNPKFLDLKTAMSIEVVPDAPPGAYDLKFTK
jgi:hypothetical protein